MARGWERGIRSGVFLAAAIPASRATARTSPLVILPARMAARVAGFMVTVARATAVRMVGLLPLTSTMTAWPLASKWLNDIKYLLPFTFDGLAKTLFSPRRHEEHEENNL